MNLQTEVLERYRHWMTDDYFDEETKRELAEIEDDEKELEDRFYRELTFGTGGLRGIIGAGTNRMNIYTVRKATQGIANLLRDTPGEQSAVIAYDSRHMSAEFATETALCFAANGIKSYIFPDLRPTPELSFAVRELGCMVGIVITASHNPAEYNGYKVYWSDGGQITGDKAKEIISRICGIKDESEVLTMDIDRAKEKGLYCVLTGEMDDRYIEAVKSVSIHPEVIAKQAENISIVYTPLHGTGNVPVRRVLKEAGFQKVYVVGEQAEADGDFPTVAYPNPEDAEAFSMALALAKDKKADIVLATDPDADRLGMYVREEKTGEYHRFSGNMLGVILLEYILEQRKENGMLPENGAVVTTIVSGKMAGAICRSYGTDLIETLTGFKYIGEQIKLFEANKDHTYIFGFEESYGCLVGTYARDKDAVSAVMLLCEVAAYCKQRGTDLWSMMQQLYRKYGFYKEDLLAVTLKGKDGKEKIDCMMKELRENRPETIGGRKVKRMYDYLSGRSFEMDSGRTGGTGLPASDVLYFELEGDAWCCVRPSGTEPKIKFYIGVRGNDDDHAADELLRLSGAVKRLADMADIEADPKRT